MVLQAAVLNPTVLRYAPALGNTLASMKAEDVFFVVASEIHSRLDPLFAPWLTALEGLDVESADAIAQCEALQTRLSSLISPHKIAVRYLCLSLPLPVVRSYVSSICQSLEAHLDMCTHVHTFKATHTAPRRTTKLSSTLWSIKGLYVTVYRRSTF